MSQVKTTGPQFDQGAGGGGLTKANGSHLSPAKDVVLQGPTGDPMGQQSGNTRPSPGKATDAPVKLVAGSDSTAVRGGGGINGHSRNKISSRATGSKNDQNPNVKNKNDGPSGTYLGR